MPAETGIFNVLDNGIAPGNPPTTNTAMLQALVTMLLSSDGLTQGNGGTIEFPMVAGGTSLGTYSFSGTVTVGLTDSSPPGNGPATIIFRGTCKNSYDETSVAQIPMLQQIPVEGQPTPTDLFLVSNEEHANDAIGGIIFEDLSIAYDNTLTDGAAIHVDGSQNVKIHRVVFQSCPTAVYIQRGLQCSIVECTALTDLNLQSCVVLGDQHAAIETYIAGCLFRTLKTTGGIGTGIQINKTEHIRMMNTRLEEFQYGIVFQPTAHAVRNHFENVSIRQSSQGEGTTLLGGAVLIQPQSGGKIQETVFVGCEFAPSDDAGTIYTLGGVYVDASNGTIDVLRFVSCTALNWHGPGLQVLGGGAENSCAHIEVLGGEYSSNGQPIGETVSTQPYGIVIGDSGNGPGTVTNVRISGLSSTGSVLGLEANQTYGIYVTDGAENVSIEGCDLTGNATGAAAVAAGTGTAPTNIFIRNCNATGYGAGSPLPPSFAFSSPGTVQVSNCAGYNDQVALLSSSAPSSTFNGLTYGYYGPVAFYTFGGEVEVEINGHNTELTSGGFTLGPGETALFIVGLHPPTTFYIFGK